MIREGLDQHELSMIRVDRALAAMQRAVQRWNRTRLTRCWIRGSARHRSQAWTSRPIFHPAPDAACGRWAWGRAAGLERSAGCARRVGVVPRAMCAISKTRRLLPARRFCSILRVRLADLETYERTTRDKWTAAGDDPRPTERAYSPRSKRPAHQYAHARQPKPPVALVAPTLEKSQPDQPAC